MSPAVRAGIARSLGADVREVAAVGGGCISPAYRVWLTTGRCVFVKLAPASAVAGMLAEEARALRVLERANCVRVPRVLASGAQWLALEWLEPARGTAARWRELGRALACLHRQQSATYGWEHDNFIGTLAQANARSTSWPEFWRERRLRPQLHRAHDSFEGATRAQFDVLLERLDELLQPVEEEGASLLHGDLWSGNVHMSVAGAALIDPSSYYGHREVDLAMAALFGGFPAAFFDAYAAEWPLRAGFALRRHVYQLYYLLVHVNLFGGGYAASAAAALRSALAQR